MKNLIFIFLVFYISINSQTIIRIPGSPYPASTKPDTLFQIIDNNFSESQLLTIETLQGILAQSKPQIFRTSSLYNNWLTDLKNNYGVIVNSNYNSNFSGLLDHFKNQIKSYVLCNLNDNSVNVAISLCGITSSVAVTTDDTTLFNYLGIPMLLDVRGKNETWFFNNYGSQVNKNIFCFQSETKDTFLADYSAFGKMITFYNDTFDVNTNNILNSFNANAALLGWGPDEFQTVSKASSYNIFVNAADYANNISTLTNFNAVSKQKTSANPIQSQLNTHTVCFLMTDGDNLQWTLSDFSTNQKYYGSINRGKINMGWTISPSMCELAPTVLKYFYDNEASSSTGRDYFVAGASGLGYTYPDKYPDVNDYAALTNSFMEKADLRIMNIIGNDDSDKYLLPFLLKSNIDAIFYYFYSNYSGGAGEIKWINGKPVIYGRYNLWDGYETPTSLAQKLNNASTNIYSSSGYSLIPVHAWSESLDSVISCINKLNSNIRVVTPDEFVALIKKNLEPRSTLLSFATTNNLKELSYIVPGDTGSMHKSFCRLAYGNDKIVYRFNKDSLLSISGGVNDLLLNMAVSNEYVVSISKDLNGPYNELFRWSKDSTQQIHNNSNYTTLSLSLQQYYEQGWNNVYISLEAGIKTDTWGASIYNISILQPQIISEVKNDNQLLPENFKLEQNFPNPFNPSTLISYTLNNSGRVVLKIYNVLGKLINTLVDSYQQRGQKTVNWDGCNSQGQSVTSGVYFYRLETEGKSITKKMMLLR